jgi:hypothetical protein
MARTTIKRYRRKTVKNKSKVKKLRLKKTLKLKPKRRNGKKKTQKRFRLKNKRKYVKKGGDGDTMPERSKYNTSIEFFKAVQEYNIKKIADMQIEDPALNRSEVTYRSDTISCTNVDHSSGAENELGVLDNKYLKFKFEDQDHIYCYNYSDIKHDLNNISNICCVWKKTNPDAADNSEGYGTSCVVQNTRNLLNNVCDYINGATSHLDTEGHEFVDDINNYLCVWRSLINVRTWISHEAIKTINMYKDKEGIFTLKPKQHDRMIIGNLYNVFGVGMLHGQQPGEFVYDIEFEHKGYNPTTTDNILETDSLLKEYDEIYNQFWNAPPSPDDPDYDPDYDLNNDSFASQSQGTVFDIRNPTTPTRNIGTPIEQMSPISPNRQLFADSPDGTPIPSIREELETSTNRSYVISNNSSVPFDTLSPWRHMEDVLRDMDTTGSYHRAPPVVSIPTNVATPTTDGFVYLSPSSNLRPRSQIMGNTFDTSSSGPQERTPPRTPITPRIINNTVERAIPRFPTIGTNIGDRPPTSRRLFDDGSVFNDSVFNVDHRNGNP